MSRQSKVGFSLMLIGLVFVGCDESTTKTEPGEIAETFKSAVTDLVAMKNKIRDGFASGDIDAAHGPLHEVGHVLGKLASLAGKEDLGLDQMNALKQATEELFDAFGEVDKTLHGREGKTFEEVADVVSAAMKTIADMAGVQDDSAPPSTSESDEDGDVEVSDANAPDEVQVEDAGAPEEDGN